MAHLTADAAFSFVTIVIYLFTSLICLIGFLVLLHHLRTKTIKNSDFIILTINANILGSLTVVGTLICLFCFQRIFGQIYDYTFQSTWCTFNGYFVIVLTYVTFSVFAIQAMYRLCRVVYPAKRWLQTKFIYQFIGIIQLMIGLIIVSPVLIWNEIEYLPNSYYCFTPLTNLRGIIWTIGTAYGIPILILFVVYLRLTIFLRNQPNQIIINIQRRQQQQRDMTAIRRILLTFTCLLIIGIPTIIHMIIGNITGIVPPLSYHIQWFTGSISSIFLCGTTILSTSHLKNIILNKFRQNQVQNISNAMTTAVQLKTITVKPL